MFCDRDIITVTNIMIHNRINNIVVGPHESNVVVFGDRVITKKRKLSCIDSKFKLIKIFYMNRYLSIQFNELTFTIYYLLHELFGTSSVVIYHATIILIHFHFLHVQKLSAYDL